MELYSDEEEVVSLEGWSLVDKAGKSYSLSLLGEIFPGGRVVFSLEGEGWLNNSDEEVFLKRGDEIEDSFAYSKTKEGESFARIPDGGEWAVTEKPSPGEANLSSLPTASLSATPTSTSTPALTPTLTLTPTPSLTPGIYRINEVKDENGEVLSQVKIYLDGVYLHHYAPEEIVFCPDCLCGEVECGFGSHLFRLEKTGYHPWEEEKTINPGDLYLVNPVMRRISPSPTPTLTSTPTPSPTLTLTLTPTSTPTSTPTLFPSLTSFEATASSEEGEFFLSPQGEVLGEKKEIPKRREGGEKRKLAIGLILSGMGINLIVLLRKKYGFN